MLTHDTEFVIRGEGPDHRDVGRIRAELARKLVAREMPTRAIAAREDVSAVFCANDQLALGVLRALHEAGRNVPGEISVVGFDDNPESAEYWPPLTTVRQNFAEVGQHAFALLNQAIQRETVGPGLRLIDNELVVRDSTGPYMGRQ